MVDRGSWRARRKFYIEVSDLHLLLRTDFKGQKAGIYRAFCSRGERFPVQSGCNVSVVAGKCDAVPEGVVGDAGAGHILISSGGGLEVEGFKLPSQFGGNEEVAL